MLLRLIRALALLALLVALANSLALDGASVQDAVSEVVQRVEQVR